jgi:hypothetical protein
LSVLRDPRQLPRAIARDLARVSLRPLGSAAGFGLRLIGRPIGALDGELRGVNRTHPVELTQEAVRSELPADDRWRNLSDELGRLLERSVGQSQSSSQYELYAHILRQLVPDEARILSALSDGGSAPVVHVVSRARAGRAVLENASSVGRSAGVALPDLVPTYVSQLLGLGLVELGPATDTHGTEFELLMAETMVRSALERAAADAVLPPRIVRETLRLSALGQALWTACRPVTEPET